MVIIKNAEYTYIQKFNVNLYSKVKFTRTACWLFEGIHW
jgi:hypothetical protein